MKIRKSFIIGIIVTILLLIGAVIAYYLSQRPQEIRQRASGGAFGKAIVFDGTSTVVRTPQKVYLQAPFTIEGWIKPDYIPNISTTGPELIFASDIPTDSSCTNQLYLGLTEKNPPENGDLHTAWLTAVVRNDQTIIGGVSDKAFMPFDKWGHVAVTADTDGTLSIFINGKKMDEQKLSGPICINSNFAIGSRQNQFGVGNLQATNDSGYTNAYKGQLDEIRISHTVRYTNDFTPATEPYLIDPQTSALAHLDGTLIDEFSNVSAVSEGTVTYVDSTLPQTTAPPVCQPNISTCEWDAVSDAVSYHYKITRILPETGVTQGVVAEGDVQAPATSITFISEDNATYTCEVAAANVCGTGGKASATATCTVPTATPTPLPSSTPTPTNSPTPTNTPSPTPTTTPVPSSTPTPTKPPVPTPTKPPLATNTPVPTNTPIPTNTPGPIVATNTPTPTLPSPGSPIETITIAGGILLTIVGAILLFAL